MLPAFAGNFAHVSFTVHWKFHRILLDLIKEPLNIDGKAEWKSHLYRALEV